MAKRDYYDILGINKGSSESEIKKAYRKLAQQHHPDKGGDVEKFKEINEAHETLKDSQKRSAYDQFGHAVGGQSSGFSGFGQNGFDFSGANFDFSNLGDMFGGFGDIFGQQQSRSTRSQFGNDIETEIGISFTEMAFGTEKKIRLEKLSTCESCKGTGAKDGEMDICSRCQGKGRIEIIQNTILGRIATAAVCPDCQGSGYKAKKPCLDCNGTGRKRQIEEINIKIPAGIEDRQRLRMRGRGEAGEKGAESGDLYIRINVKPDPYFVRDGKNIHTVNSIDVSIAALGGILEIKTLHGDKKIKIPSGTQPGKILVLKGGGIKPAGVVFSGDHLVEIKVEIPKKLTSNEKRLWEELRDLQ